MDIASARVAAAFYRSLFVSSVSLPQGALCSLVPDQPCQAVGPVMAAMGPASCCLSAVLQQ